MWLWRRISSTTKIRRRGGAGGTSEGVKLAGRGFNHGQLRMAGHRGYWDLQYGGYLFLAHLLIAGLAALVGSGLLIALSGGNELTPQYVDAIASSLGAIPFLVVGLALINLAVLASAIRKDWRWRSTCARLKDVNRSAMFVEKVANVGRWNWDGKADRLQLTDQGRELLSIKHDGPGCLETFVSAFHQDDRARVLDAIGHAIQTGRGFASDARVVRDDGTIRWLAVSARVQQGRYPDAPLKLLGVAADITGRKQMEDDIESMRKQVRQLAQAASFGSLSGALAHELKQPLAAIMSNAQAAERMLQQEPINVTELSNTLKDIIDDDGRAGAVITHLRALFKNDEGSWTNLDINELLPEAVRLVNNQVVEWKVDLEVEAATLLPCIRGNRVQLRQVLLNLLSNAIDAMESNLDRPRQIRIKTYAEDDSVTIAISDTGIGLPATNVDDIFTAFFTTKAQGLGLGLAICRSVVVSHGGKIWANNNSSGGSTFFVSLPTSRSERFEQKRDGIPRQQDADRPRSEDRTRAH